MWKNQSTSSSLSEFSNFFFIKSPVDEIKPINPKMNNSILSRHIPRTNIATSARTIINS